MPRRAGRLDGATRAARADLNGEQSPPDEDRTSWAPLELGAVLSGERLVEPPTLLLRSDDKCLVYGDRIHAFFGEPETGKGWLVAALAAECIARGEHVLYLDFETEPADVIERLRALKAKDEAIAEFLHYARPDEPLDNAGWEDLASTLALRRSLVIVDGMTDALTLHGVKLQDNTEVAQWLRDVPRRLKARTGGAIVTVDHVTKNRETRGGYQLGAQHKRAGSEVTYEIVLKEPIGRGMKGEIKIRVRKDRPGHIRPLATDGWVANVELDSDPEGPMHLSVRPPEEREGEPKSVVRTPLGCLRPIPTGGRKLI